jgi:tRNA(adenine34) deaminase
MDLRMMTLALKAAQQAAEMDEVPVGAVLRLADGQVFTAHNQPISSCDPSSHAELNVIRKACIKTNNYRLLGSSLYVTLEPCLMCSGAIIHARIARLVYGASDPKTGAVHSLYRTLSDNRLNHQPDVSASVMKEECSALLRHFFRDKRKREVRRKQP